MAAERQLAHLLTRLFFYYFFSLQDEVNSGRDGAEIFAITTQDEEKISVPRLPRASQLPNYLYSHRWLQFTRSDILFKLATN